VAHPASLVSTQPAQQLLSGQPPALPPADGTWQIRARGDMQVQVQWWVRQQGQQVRLLIQQLRGPGPALSYDALLGLVPPLPREGTWAFGPPPPAQVEMTLDLRPSTGSRPGAGPRVELWVNVPVAPNEMREQSIGEWPLQEPPVPPAPPAPPAPADPADEPVVVDDHAAGQDLFNTCWLQPLGLAERHTLAWRGMTPAAPGSLPLVQQLAACTGSPAAVAQARRTAASAFLAGGAPNLTSVSGLQAPTSGFAQAYTSLLQALAGPQSGPMSLQDQLSLVSPYLAPDTSLDAYLADASTATDTEALWQTVIALALAGTASQGLLATQLVNTLRVQHYLQTLQDELTATTQPGALVDAQVRRWVLQATPGLPDDCAAWALAGQVPTPDAAPAGNTWRLLGVGQLALARQQPLGYALGELAEVVNVLPRERQERSERSVMADEDSQHQHHQQHSRQGHRHHADASNELADTLKARFHSQGELNNLSNLTQTYSNPNLVLGGTTAQGEARLDAVLGQQGKLLQRSGEQAAHSVAEQVQQQRQVVRRHWLEQQASRCIDNSAGQRLVGVYRWIDRLLRLQLQPQGARLVLAFDLLQPAQAWLDQLAAQGPVPLQKPLGLQQLTPPVTGYSVIQPGNYQALGAAYGLSDLPAPPPDTINLSLQVLPSSAGQSVMQVPPGYAATSGSANLALGNQGANAVASVAGQVLSPVGSSSPAGVTLNQDVPATTASTVAALALALPASPLATLPATQALTFSPPLTGAVPVTVLSDAPLYILSVSLSCQRVGLGGGAQPDQLLQAWQLQVYDRLVQAWQQAARGYAGELALRVQRASEVGSDVIQRQCLQAACLATLSQSSATSDPALLTGGLDWAAMSWHYEATASTLGGPLPISPDAAVSTTTPPGQVPAAQQLFDRFVHAAAARVLVPLQPAQQTALLFALQWQAAWPSPAVPQPQAALAIPLSLAAAPFVVEQLHAPTPQPGPPWTVRLPTPQMYLQGSDQLPGWASGARNEVVS